MDNFVAEQMETTDFYEFHDGGMNYDRRYAVIITQDDFAGRNPFLMVEAYDHDTIKQATDMAEAIRVPDDWGNTYTARWIVDFVSHLT